MTVDHTYLYVVVDTQRGCRTLNKSHSCVCWSNNRAQFLCLPCTHVWALPVTVYEHLILTYVLLYISVETIYVHQNCKLRLDFITKCEKKKVFQSSIVFFPKNKFLCCKSQLFSNSTRSYALRY